MKARNKKEEFSAFLERGKALFKLGKSHEAIKMYDKALAIYPDNRTARYHKAIVLHKLGKYDEEARLYDDKTLAAKWAAGFIVEVGDASYRHLMYEDALEKYNQALTTDPKDIEVLSRKGAALEKLERRKEAMAAYDKILAIDPYHPVIHKKALILFGLGKYEEALSIYEKWLARYPKDGEIRRARLLLREIIRRKNKKSH